MTHTLLRALSAMSCCLALGACGQRGPLVLPPAAQATPSPPSADGGGHADPKKPSSPAANPS